jgi:tetratricopeptide (TPR) repeat protein
MLIKMKNTKIYLLLLFVIINLTGYSQDLLKYKLDETYGGGVCATGNAEACIYILADKSLMLTFSSDLDPKLTLYQELDKGSSTQYLLNFLAGELFAERILQITSQRLEETISIPLYVLQNKESRRYIVYAEGCYETIHQECLDLYAHGSYPRARKKYMEAQKCYDAPKTGEIELEIAKMDSIIHYQNMADECFELLEYTKARGHYTKILQSYNPDDEHAKNRERECIRMLNQTCQKYYTKAEYYFREHEYEKAKALYEKIIDDNCNQEIEAKIKLEETKRIILFKEQRATSLTYEFSNGLPIGLSIGGYKNKKGGVYFTIMTNPAFFNYLRSNYEKAVKPEISGILGGTFRPVKHEYSPIWISIGIGYTMVGAYYYNENKDGEEKRLLYKGGDLPDNFDTKAELYHAVSPEIGLLGKIKFVSLRYTLQYRFAFDKDQQEYVRPFRHGFGIGFCF